MKKHRLSAVIMGCCILSTLTGIASPSHADPREISTGNWRDPARPESHETILIDGDLTDLIDAVNANLGASNGGFIAPGVAGNVYTASCAYANGFDIVNNYALFDFKNSSGDFTPNDVTLYLGWEVDGAIGDVDGDGDPNTYTAAGNFTCANNGDQMGIGPSEAYKVFLDLNCDFVPDITICLMNNHVLVEPNTPIPGAAFAFNGSFLEVKVPNMQNLLPAGGSFCEANLFLTANSTFDGLGEDFSPTLQLRLDPRLEVTKTPPVQDACAGRDVSWTIMVKNTGLCILQQVVVKDTLSAGMTFVSSNPPSSGDSQNRSWTFMNVVAGAEIVVSLTANVTAPCAAETHLNTVAVEGVHESGCGDASGVMARTTASVNCRNTPCSIDGPVVALAGETHVFTTTVGAGYDRIWSVTSTPADICNVVGGNTGASIQVNFTAAGTCTVSLTVTDPADPETCVNTCDLEVTVEEEDEGICLVLIDEDGIDNGFSRIQQAAAGHNVTPDFLVNDDRPTEVGNPPFRWNELFPGDIVLLPTGQVDDEGWFALPEITPWPLADFANGTVPQSRLDKIPNVMPLRNHELVQLVGRTCVAVVYDSDISMNYLPILANLQGARLGLFTFTVLAVEVPGAIPEAQSNTSLYSLWLRVESPMTPTFSAPVTVRDHEPDAIETTRARYSSGALTVWGESDFAPGAIMTLSVDGPDAGNNPAVDPFRLEAPMPYNPGTGQYEFSLVTGVNVLGRRLTISTNEGGAYNTVISGSSAPTTLSPLDAPRRPALAGSPNPIRGELVAIRYVVPVGSAPARLEIFDAAGRLVKRLVEAGAEPGEFTVRWNLTDEDGRRVPDGVYFYRLEAGADVLYEKAVIRR